jgi:hypothetical protein
LLASSGHWLLPLGFIQWWSLRGSSARG